jgi:hypothetical protein
MTSQVEMDGGEPGSNEVFVDCGLRLKFQHPELSLWRL